MERDLFAFEKPSLFITFQISRRKKAKGEDDRGKCGIHVRNSRSSVTPKPT
jgi:hypothetical protein